MKKKIIAILIIIATSIVLILNYTNTIKKTEDIEENLASTTTESVITENQKLIIYTDDLAVNNKNESVINKNTKILQEAIDRVSNAGGGIVHIPAGTYYFASGGAKNDGSSNYVIKCKNNVIVEGEGTDDSVGTVLKPIGTTTYGLDMFYFNNYAEGLEPVFLENADFRNFTINSDEAIGQIFNSSGKGFMINIFKNCDWENIVVKNTDGTGFGVDCPINSTIKNCTAIGCGKKATITDVGASGFGIGTGYRDDEYMLITNCTATGNKKYGFFFEHQGIWTSGKSYTATKGESFVVSDCTASGNLYDFGGNKAYDVTYVNCNSYYKEPNKSAVYFEGNSVRTNVITNKITESKTFEDVNNSAYYYTPVHWAYQAGITSGWTDTLFAPDEYCKRKSAILMLYRAAGLPGDITYGNIETGYTDVDGSASYAGAVKWAEDAGVIASSTNFYPDVNITRADFITFLWRYAGGSVVTTENNFSDVENGTYYENAINWAVEKGIIFGVEGGSFYPNEYCTRGDFVTFLYRYMNNKNEFSIKYNLQGGNLTIENPTTYNAGEDTFTLNNPTRDGYTFEGWIGRTCTETTERSICVPEKSIEITTSDVGNKAYTAIWSANSYKISFKPNGGIGEMEDENFYYDVPQVLSPNEFTKEGYDFKCWNTKANGTGTSYTDAQAVNNLTKTANGTITLYAQWTKTNAENRKNIFLGASGFVEMHFVVGGDESWHAMRGKGLEWMKEKGVSNAESEIGKNTNVVIRMGTNDLFYLGLNNGEVDIDGVVKTYKKYLNAKAIEWIQAGANVYFVSMGPFDDSKIDSTTRKVNDTDAVKFNNKIQEELEGIKYIDVYTGIIEDFNKKQPDLTRDDGTHGVPLLYSKQYKLMKDALGQTYTPTYEVLDNMNDIDSNDECYIPVKWAYENAYINPTSNTTFSPDTICTRADIISLIWSSQKIPYIWTDLTFADVADTDIYYDAIGWAVNKNIVSGYTETIFGPNDNCSRGAFISFLWRLAGKPEVSIENIFTDEGTYANAINWAVSEGIVKNNNEGTFLPEEGITREDAITYLYRYYNPGVSYTVKYLEKDTNVELAEAKVVENQVFGTEITETAIEVEGYDFVGETQKTITIGVEANEIIFYYTKRTNLSYTVKYLEKGTENELADSKVVENQVFKSEITETAIEIEGYNKSGETEKTITVEVSENEIIFYYERRSDLSYTVKYLEKGTEIELAETKVVENQIYKSEITEQAIEIPGYSKSGETEKTIIIEVSGNEIIFYYEKINKSYTVKYNYTENGGTKADKETVQQTVGEQIDLSITATKEGYEFVGWNTDKDATIGLTELTMEEKNITLYAIFKKNIKLEFIDYKGTTQTKIKKEIIIYNKNKGELKAPKINEYTGWSAKYWTINGASDAEKTIENEGIITDITESKTYYARYGKEIKIKFNLNGGIGYLLQEKSGEIDTNSKSINTIKKLQIIIPNANVERNGYIFDGWNSKSDGTGIDYKCGEEARFDSNTTLYVKWRKEQKDDTITSSIYNITKTNISKVKPNTTVQNFMKNIECECSYVIKDLNNNTVRNTSKIGTGFKVVVETGREYTIVVLGDISGDGKINLSELAKAQKMYLGIENPDEIEVLAFDLDFSKRIDLKDLAKLQKVYLGIINL